MSGEEFEQALPVVRSKVLERLGGIVEDAFQEISYRASQKADQFANEEELFAYIWAATEQELRRDMARDGERRGKLRGLRALTPKHTSAGDCAERQEWEQACEGLTEEQKQAVWEVLYDGAGLRDVGLPRETTRRLVAKVREKLRNAA